eukprot:SAG31_NODE_46066_length_256_cov_0.649682_1_plen_40_part_10
MLFCQGLGHELEEAVAIGSDEGIGCIHGDTFSISALHLAI